MKERIWMVGLDSVNSRVILEAAGTDRVLGTGMERAVCRFKHDKIHAAETDPIKSLCKCRNKGSQHD